MVSGNQLSRQELLRRVQGLYVAHASNVRQALGRLAPELDADDLLHEVFVVAVRKCDEVSAAESPRAWLYGVAVKLAASRRRTSRVRRFFGLETLAAHTAVDAPSRTAEQHEAQQLVAVAMKTLTAAKRDVLVLYELEGLSGEEIALALRIPLKTVWTRLFHARREFASALHRLDEEGVA